MNLSELRAFCEVAEGRSFSVAAERLFITQPAVSKRIQALELDLGTPLFDRVGKRVYVTQTGEMLLQQARKILNLVTDTEKMVTNLRQSVAGKLNIATSHHIGLHRLAPVLRSFTDQFHNVALNIDFEDSEVAHEMIRHGETELAVVTLNPQGDDELVSTPLWDDSLTFVSAAPRRPASLEELAGQPCVLPGTGTYTGRIVLDRFQSAGINLEPAMSTNYLETIGMLVSVGLGWSVLPSSMLGHLHEFDVDCPQMSRTLGVVTNPQRTMSNAADAFMEVLTTYRDPAYAPI
jgi:DNA-binding transcriptional LysR family regulator